MPERYRRAEDALADLIRENRRGTRDAQRATGTEKAQTTQVAEQAASDALDAIAAAATADMLAKGAVTFSTSNPTSGDAAGKPIGALWTVLSSNAIVSYWELTSLGWIQRPLSTTVIPQINIGTGTFGSLAGSRLAVDALDGKTITGALIRTAASGQRLELGVNGLAAYDSSGSLVSRLFSANGSFNVRAALTASETPSQIWLTATKPGGGGGIAQLRADASRPVGQTIGASALINAQSTGAAILDLTSGSLNRVGGSDARFLVTAKSGGVGNAAGNVVYLETEPAGLPMVLGDRYGTGDVQVSGKLSVNGFEVPTETALLLGLITVRSGYAIQAGSWVQKRSDGFVRGVLIVKRTSGAISGDTNGADLLTLPTGWRPSGAWEGACATSQGGNASINFGQITSGGAVRAWNATTGNQQAAWQFEFTTT